MALKPDKRAYNFSDAVLLENGDAVIVALDRDVADFATYGYTPAKVTALKALRTAFQEFPTDEYYSNLVSEAVLNKRAAIKKVDKTFEKIILMAELVFEKGSPKRAAFEYVGYGKKRDTDRLQLADTLQKQATERLSDLSASGLTAVILADFDNDIDDARASVVAKIEKVKERDAKTRERILAANAYYKGLLDVCKIGRQLYEDTDESKYNDYVMNTSGHGPDAEIITGEPAPGIVHLPSVTIVSGDEEIEFQNTGTVPLTIYFAAEVDDEPEATDTIVAAGDTFIGTATDLGFAATQPRFLIKNNATEVGAFEMRVG